MNVVSPEVWMRLAGERVPGEALWARRAMPNVSDRLIAALDADGERHLLVRLDITDADVRDIQSRGIGLVTRELAIAGHETGKYLDLVCRDATGHDAFDIIGGEIAVRLASGHETASEVMSRVLAKWRRFWGQPTRLTLSREEQIGLFAELWFLIVWLLPQAGLDESIKRWRGPFGARHDFEWTKRSVEVKATVSTRGLIHRINGLEQLVPPEGGRLFFFSLHLREEAGASNTLSSLVSRCRSLFSVHPHAMEYFETSLERAGYCLLDEDEYAKQHFRVVDEQLFEVEEDFPRLIPDRITGGLPPGVESVEYSINLSGFAHRRVAQQPRELHQDTLR